MTELAIAAAVPKEQRLVYRITPLPGKFMNAEAVGKQLTAIARLLKSVAQQDEKPTKWAVLLLNITTEESGAIEFEVAIAPYTQPAASSDDCAAAHVS